jgi:hypothetical protein
VPSRFRYPAIENESDAATKQLSDRWRSGEELRSICGFPNVMRAD